MRRIFLLTSLSVLCYLAANGQNSSAFSRSESMLSERVGYAYTGVATSLVYEYNLVDGLLRGTSSLGIGGYVGYFWEYSHGIAAARVTLHNQLCNGFDLYGGALGGVRMMKFEETGWGGKPITAIFLGGRYMFTNTLGMDFELSPTSLIDNEIVFSVVPVVSVGFVQKF